MSRCKITANITGWGVTLGAVSVAYLTAFAMSISVLMPVQKAILPDFANHVSILFLPHGVRVLTAWLYGWKALALLAPSALLSHAYLYCPDGFSAGYFFAALFGILCATLSFWLLAKFGMDFRHKQTRLASWKDILLAGSLASIINVAGTACLYGFDLLSASAYFVGDLAGLLGAMLLLMWAFRMLRKTT